MLTPPPRTYFAIFFHSGSQAGALPAQTLLAYSDVGSPPRQFLSKPHLIRGTVHPDEAERMVHPAWRTSEHIDRNPTEGTGVSCCGRFGTAITGCSTAARESR